MGVRFVACAGLAACANAGVEPPPGNTSEAIGVASERPVRTGTESIALDPVHIGLVGYPTLGAAVAAAVDGDVITLDDGVYIVRNLLIDDDVTITSTSGDRDAVTIDGRAGGKGPTLNVASALTLRSLTMTEASQGAVDALRQGGGPITVDDCVFLDNVSVDAGGAIAASEITVTDSVFVRNTALTGTGGAIHAAAPGLLTVSGSKFISNDANQDSGGAIFSTASVVATDVEIRGNTGAGLGGGISVFADDGFVDLERVTIDENHSGGGGGGVGVIAASMTVTDSRMEGNTSGFDGAGLLFDATVAPRTLTLTNVDIVDNKAGLSYYGDGAGMYVFDAVVDATGLNVVGNDGDNGGGVWFVGTESSTVRDSLFEGNLGGWGGGALVNGDVTFENVTFLSNFGEHEGGALSVNDGAVVLDTCAIGSNSTDGSGGGIMVNRYQAATLTVLDTNLGSGVFDNTPTDLVVGGTNIAAKGLGSHRSFMCDPALGSCIPL